MKQFPFSPLTAFFPQPVCHSSGSDLQFMIQDDFLITIWVPEKSWWLPLCLQVRAVI